MPARNTDDNSTIGATIADITNAGFWFISSAHISKTRVVEHEYSHPERNKGG
jgi:hypothetical protein